VSCLRDDHACQQAVESPAETTAAEADGIAKADLLDIFAAKVDRDALATIDVSAARSDLAYALEVRANTTSDISCEAVLDSFLQAVNSGVFRL